jgi:hypothetical protein
MSERTLKHYDKYMDALDAYAKASKIKVIYQLDDFFDGGMYVSTTRTIYLEPDLADSIEVAAFLHELGHALESSSPAPPKEQHTLYQAYEAVYAERASLFQRVKVLQCEKKAWEFGETIAKLLRIPLGKWFFDYKKECLKDYENP